MKKKVLALTMGVVMAAGMLTGCSGGKSTETKATQAASEVTAEAGKETAKNDKKEEPVELKWYIRFDDQADTAKVNEELNKLLLEKINCTVKIANIPAAAWNDKMQVILGGREECDIVFSGAGFADFWGNAARGAFTPLNNLLAEYGKGTYDAIPEQLWDGVKIKDEIYGVINYQIEAKEAGYYVPTAILEKYNFDLSKVEKMEDIEPLLEQIRKDDPSIIPLVVKEDALFPMIGYDEIGTLYSPGAVMIGDESLTVTNQYETEEWRNFVTTINRWYNAGYIAADAATIESYNDLMKAGKVAVFLNDMKPGGEQEQEILWGCDLTSKKIMDGRVLPSAVSATLQCIPSTSKHPEKAMEFINLLNTDKDVYNLVCFGIEGTHYTKVGDNRIEMVENSGYQPNKAWAMGNQFNAYLVSGQADNVWEETIKLNESASVSGLLGYVFDQEPVKNQMAQCQSVVDQYLRSIMRGTVDPEKYIPEFLDKLKAAGADEIIAEKQAQLDAWKETR